jgi:hypothetical protein
MNGVDLVRAMRADAELQALPVIVQTTDPTALRAPVWKTLQVAKVLDKMRFVDWCEEQMAGLPLHAAAAHGAPGWNEGR